MSGRKRSLYRATLAAEPGIQEQGVKELVAAALQAKDAQADVDALWQLLQQPPPPKATFMLCSAVCQGLLRLALEQRLDPSEAIKRLLEAMEAAIGADDDPDVAFGAKVALMSVASPYVALYASTMAKLCIVSMSGGGPDAAFRWTERPPLATALGLNPTKMASAVLEEVGFNRLAALPPRPHVTMPGLACPVICAVIFQPQFGVHRPQLLQCLSLLPFEYLPEHAVHALALAWASLLPFLPCRTTEDLSFWSDWAKLVFRALCHLETPAWVEDVGRLLASSLVRQALEQAQGPSSGGIQAPLLPLLVLLERLADYSPALMADSFGLIAFLCDTSPAGDERAVLLRVLEACVGAQKEASGPFSVAHLRWAAGPLLQLASREDAVRGGLLNAVLSSVGPTEAQGGVWTRPGSASIVSLEREALSSSGAVSGPLSRRWALFLLSARLLEADSCERERLLSLLEKLLEADPLVGSRSLPLLLHLLNLWKGQGQLQLRLLDCLVPLARHQLGALLVQALIRRLPLLEPPGVPGSEEARRLQVVMGSACLQLSVKLFKANSRTLTKLRHLLLEGSTLGDEVDEYRLSRIQGIGEVISENPEAGSEFIGVVQTYLTDPLPAVVALAVDCITFLCTADCLDYLAAVRILSKKGRLAHRDHPMVMANLADLYGAAAYVFDCSPAAPPSETLPEEGGGSEVEEPQEEVVEEEEARPRLSDKHLLVLSDNLWVLSLSKGQPEVRARAYRALGGFAAALLASEEEGVAEGLRSRLLAALREEREAAAREGLQELVTHVLRIESQDAATWGRALLKTGQQDTAAKPSRKTMKSLPTAAEVLAMYRSKGSAGAAGACLCAVSAEPSAVPALLDVLVDALSDEDGGGRCIIQRLISAQGFLRFLPPLLEQLSKAKQASLDPFAAEVAAVEEVQAAILTELRNPGARNVNNCFLALAALANSLSPQLSHKAKDAMDVLLAALEGVASSITVDVAVLQLALGMAGRCLDASQGKLVLSLFSKLSQAGQAFAARTDLDWCLWGGSLGLGSLTDWVRQLYSPDLSALLLLSGASRACLSVLQQRMRSSSVAAMLEEGATYSVQAMQQSAALGAGPVLAWCDIDVAAAEACPGDDLQVVGACYALSLIVVNLGHAGLERQVVQLYHVARAAVEAGVPGAELMLSAAASLGVRGSLVESEEVFGAFRLLTARVDAGQHSESLLLALANLVVGVRGSLTLPGGFVDDVKARLLGIVREGGAAGTGSGAAEGGRATGLRIAALLSVYTLLGNGGPTCSLLQASVGEGFSPDRKTAAVTASLVEALKTGMASSSQRFANACARVLGLLVALRTEGTVAGGEAGESSSRGPGMSTAQIDVGTLGLPREGTLAHDVMVELVTLAVGDLSGAQAASVAGRDFIVSALTALAACPVLRFSHKQVTQLLQNYVKASTDRVLVAACVSFAVTAAPRDSAYATWLYDVAINASARPTVLDVVVEHMGDLARLIPVGLVHRVLGTVWSHLWAKPDQRYARAALGLTHLAKALAKPSQQQQAGGGPGAMGVWPFVEGDVWPMGLVQPLAQDLQALLQHTPPGSQPGPPDSCLAVVEALCLVLARFPPDDVLSLLHSCTPGLFPSLVLCVLVERRALPCSSLKPLLHRLVGPSSSSSGPPAYAALAVPFLLRAMLSAEAVGVQAEWVLELLDFLQVQPRDLRPLFLLAHLMHGWHATWHRMLLEPTARHDWAACRDSYQRMTSAVAATSPPLAGGGLSCDDWAVLDEALAGAVAAYFKRLSPEAEVEVLSRVVKVLGAALPRESGRSMAAWRQAHEVRRALTPTGLLVMAMMRVLEGARAGQAVAAGALPTVRVLLSQYCIARAVSAEEEGSVQR